MDTPALNSLRGAIDWNDMRAVQDEITRWASDQWPNRTYVQSFHKLVFHEIPELLLHVRDHGTENIGTELADCFILLMDLATMWEVDLPEAIREKMTKNYHRQWVVDPVTGLAQHLPEYSDGSPIDPNPASLANRTVICIQCGNGDQVIPLAIEEIVKGDFGSDTHRCNRCQITFDDSIPF